MTTLTEGRHPGEFILSEANFHRSRENATIAFSQTIIPGNVLARLAVTAGVTTGQAFSGTGNGVLTFANPAVSAKVKDGVYTAVCVTAAANGGTFRIEDPAGKFIGNAVVGSAFNKEIKFTIADGSTDFVVGDSFELTIAADSDDFQFVAFNPADTGGAEIPAAIAIYGATTPADATARIAIIRRDAEVKGPCIEWPAGITATQKADAIQALEDLGIIVRN